MRTKLDLLSPDYRRDGFIVHHIKFILILQFANNNYQKNIRN